MKDIENRLLALGTQVLESKVNNLEPSLSTLHSSISSTPLEPERKRMDQLMIQPRIHYAGVRRKIIEENCGFGRSTDTNEHSETPKSTTRIRVKDGTIVTRWWFTICWHLGFNEITNKFGMRLNGMETNFSSNTCHGGNKKLRNIETDGGKTW